jgi:AMME syndrome candidate gene 1 protein
MAYFPITLLSIYYLCTIKTARKLLFSWFFQNYSILLPLCDVSPGPERQRLSRNDDDDEEEDVIVESSSLTLSVKKKLMATPTMCHYCFETLMDALDKKHSVHNSGHNTNNNHHPTKAPSFASELPDVLIECPLFVTWDKQQPSQPQQSRLMKRKGRGSDDMAATTTPPTPTIMDWHLRGCIGTLSPRRVTVALGEYALIAALNDRRFAPIVRSELHLLRVSVSLLTNYEECTNVFDWIVGIHGITIQFRAAASSSQSKSLSKQQQQVGGELFQDYNATYLPEVAKEQHWDHQKTITSLIQKAGYHGRVDDDLLKSITCTRYQSSKLGVTFHEFLAATNRTHEDGLPQRQPPNIHDTENVANAGSSSSSRHWASCNNL